VIWYANSWNVHACETVWMKELCIIVYNYYYAVVLFFYGGPTNSLQLVNDGLGRRVCIGPFSIGWVLSVCRKESFFFLLFSPYSDFLFCFFPLYFSSFLLLFNLFVIFCSVQLFSWCNFSEKTKALKRKNLFSTRTKIIPSNFIFGKF
jgi:hypothetical protein